MGENNEHRRSFEVDTECCYRYSVSKTNKGGRGTRWKTPGTLQAAQARCAAFTKALCMNMNSTGKCRVLPQAQNSLQLHCGCEDRKRKTPEPGKYNFVLFQVSTTKDNNLIFTTDSEAPPLKIISNSTAPYFVFQYAGVWQLCAACNSLRTTSIK
jgi:hypothetical protein